MEEQKNKISLDDKIINWVSANLFYSFIILVLIIFIVLLSVFGITALIYKDKTILNPNEIGDAIGGMTAPIIGLFSAFLVYIAFRAQIKANEQLQKQNEFILFDKYEKLALKLSENLCSFEANEFNQIEPYKVITLNGLKAIEQIFKLSEDIANMFRLKVLLKELKEKIISNYLMAIKTLENIEESNLSNLEKNYLSNLLYVFYYENIITHTIPRIKITRVNPPLNEDEKTFGAEYDNLLNSITNEIIPIIQKFNIKYCERKQLN